MKYDANPAYFDDTGNSALLSSIYERDADLVELILTRGGVFFDAQQKMEALSFCAVWAGCELTALLSFVRCKTA